MKARTRFVILVGLVGLLVSIAAGCRTSASRPGEFELTKGSSKAQLLSTNGIWTNGISTNGIWTNGIWTNGIWTNGIWTNGIWTNGIWTNGVSTNGIWTNGIWTNGVGTNGIWTNGIWTNGIWTNGSVTTNGIWTNGIWTNGIWTNGIWTNGLAGEALKSNRYTRQLLQYIYACAMPGTLAPGGTAGLYDTTLDPGAGPCGAGGVCGDFYECSPNNTCVIPLKGAIGLGINADGTHWWDPPAASVAGASDAATSEAGECDETCQRWVSACLLARTNAYGVHVKISMRAPANAPQGIKDALAVSDVERNGDNTGDAPYSLREGAYYGNLFATTPGSLGANGNFVPATDGTTATVIEETPAFYACAGPGSNIPEITKRFCSSQGDQVVIGVPGVCLSNPTTGEVGTCAAEDTDPNSATLGAIQHCYTSTSATSTSPCSGPSDPTCYDQVITVYLQQPIAVCGNAVCEAGESDASSPNYCPSDCHPGTWAADFAPAQQPAASLGRDVSIPYNSGVEPVRTFAIMPPPDNSIVAAGMNYGDVTFGGPAGAVGGFASGTFPASQGIGVLAKYNADGSGAGGIRFGPQPQATGSSGANRDWEIMAIAVSPANGDITVVGWEFLVGGSYAIWGSTFTASGVQVGSTWTVPTASGTRELVPEAVAVDSQSNIIFAGVYAGNVTFGQTSFFSGNGVNAANPEWDAFVAKVSPQGTVMWAKGLGLANDHVVAARSLVVDQGNNVVLLTGQGVLANSPTLNTGGIDVQGLLQRMCPDGTFGQCPDGSTPTSTGQGADLVLGTCSDGSAAKCPDHSTPWTKSLGFGGCSASHFFSAAVDGTGSVYASGYIDRNQNFGNGPITAPATSNNPPVIVKYGSDGTFEWANWANVVCPGGGTTSCSVVGACGGTAIAGVNISFDQSGNAIVASFGDSSLGGGINFGVGEFPTYSSSNIFLSSYEPMHGTLVWAKQIPMILSSSIGAMALDGNGRVVVNGGYAGSMQFDDRLLVTGVPEDPKTVDSFLASFGALSPNTAPPVIGSAMDQNGTTINTVTSHIYAEATSSAGAKVFFMPPTAVDNGNAADGGPGGSPPGTSVVCAPLPNTTFPIGTTTVTCTASDPFGQSSSASFQVTVVDTLPPIFSPYTDTTVVATSANGGTVPYPTATDQVDGTITPVCTPPAGTVLPVGQTTVQCTATDAHSNQSQATFVVTITPGTFCTTCSAQGATCGTISDGCGGTLSCGSCTAPQTCGGGGTPNVCGSCQPLTTCPAGDNCGTVTDDCGGTLSCGSCSGFLTCGGSGTANVCGCKPMTTCPAGDNCGTVPDGCGGTLSCGSCSGFLTCGGSGTANACGCKPMTACPAGDNCGTVPDGCGGALSCGSCSGSQTCGGSGTANVCGGCTPTTCAAQNAACGSIPDGCGHTLNCGSCPGPKLTLPGTITATATSASGAVVTYSASATDPVDGSIVPVCRPASGSTFALGTTTVSCTATNSHGVQATGSFQVQVQYAWSGILRPIHTDGSSIFDLGSTVRVRFSLSGASAGITNAGAAFTVTKLSSTVAGTHLQFPSSATPTTGSTFKYNPVTKHYFFNLGTSKLSAGTYSIAIDLHDGVSRTAQISLKAFTCGNCESDDGGD